MYLVLAFSVLDLGYKVLKIFYIALVSLLVLYYVTETTGLPFPAPFLTPSAPLVVCAVFADNYSKLLRAMEIK